MKRVLFALILAVAGLMASAQGNLKVTNLELKANDTEASRARKTDSRDNKCALIKIQTPDLNAEERNKLKFEADQGTECFAEYAYSEVKLYLTAGCKLLRIMHPDYVKCDYRMTMPIEGYKTYEMVVEVEKDEAGPKKVSMNSNYVKLNVTPSDATIKIDGQIRLDYRSLKLSVDEPHTLVVTHPRYHDYEKVIYASSKEKLSYDISLSPAFGWININSKPETGATVLIDGVKKGVTPYRSDTLLSGEYEVTLVKDLFENVTKTVTVRDNSSSDIELQMKPDFAEVIVKTDADADIYVDENKVGRGTWNGRLSGGDHLLEARKESHRPAMKEVSITKGKKETITLGNPVPMYGGLDITSDPDEAEVYLDNVKIGETPLMKDDVLIGTHTLRLEKQGCTTLEKTVTIEEGKMKELSEKLQTGRKITITTDRKKDEIYIDDSYAGVSPLKKTISFGEHKVKIVRDGEESSSKIVVSQTSEATISLVFKKKSEIIEETSTEDAFVTEGSFMAQFENQFPKAKQAARNNARMELARLMKIVLDRTIEQYANYYIDVDYLRENLKKISYAVVDAQVRKAAPIKEWDEKMQYGRMFNSRIKVETTVLLNAIKNEIDKNTYLKADFEYEKFKQCFEQQMRAFVNQH